MAEETKGTDNLIVINFSRVESVPVFIEINSRDWILYGERNDYPEFLTRLFNSSAKHNAIVCGKNNYIVGGGLKKRSPLVGKASLAEGLDTSGNKVPAIVVNPDGETMTDIIQKSSLDIEIYGGFRWLIIWKKDKVHFDIYHQDFYKLRAGKSVINSRRDQNSPDTRNKWYWKRNWVVLDNYGYFLRADNNKTDVKTYDEFNPNNPVGAQVFAYNEYRPGCEKYPLPGYVGAIDYIQADIEVGAHTLGNAAGGFTASKLITIMGQEPDDDGKRRIERRFTQKFTGKAGRKFLLSWAKDKSFKTEVDDLGASDMTKEDFTAIEENIQQNIYAGHQITSPALFGIKTEGQLGGTTELQAAYSIFINTYAKPKQANLEKVINYFSEMMSMGNDYYFAQLDPIGLQFDVKDVVNALPRSFVLEYFNVPKEKWDEETIGSLNKPTPTNPINPSTTLESDISASPAIPVNDNIKNLTTKQHQQLLRIIRQYGKGQLTKGQATTMLRTGLGLTDTEIESMLGTDANPTAPSEVEGQAMRFIDEDVAMVFSAFGEPRRDFTVIKSKKVKFSRVEDEDEDYYAMNFANNLTQTEALIVDQIKKDPLITPDVLSELTGQNVSWVNKKLGDLEKRGVIESNTTNAGTDTEETTRKVSTTEKVTKPAKTIYVKYSYEKRPEVKGDVLLPTSRPFCIKMIQLDRLYSRKDIETISQKLGYSVFDRAGGFWNNNGVIEYHCRHFFMSNIVVQND